MTREEAIRWTAYVQQSEPWQERVIEALDMAIEALKADRRKDEWVSCNERLPSESGYYLVTLKNPFETEVAIIWFAHIDDYGSKSEWREITDDDTVVAWMLLPEPYKGGEDE